MAGHHLWNNAFINERGHPEIGQLHLPLRLAVDMLTHF